MSFKILGTGSYAPENVVTNDDLSALVDTNDEWITQRIGVRSRHISETETNVDMAVKAAERALENAGISADHCDDHHGRHAFSGHGLHGAEPHRRALPGV